MRQALEEMFQKEPPQRKIRLYTGVGGYELLDEAMERELGYERIYVKKALRFLKLRKSITGKLYKRYGGNNIIRYGKEALSSNNGYVFSSYKSRV